MGILKGWFIRLLYYLYHSRARKYLVRCFWFVAGAVVTHDIPDGAIAVGSPARVIKRRCETLPEQWHGLKSIGVLFEEPALFREEKSA